MGKETHTSYTGEATVTTNATTRQGGVVFVDLMVTVVVKGTRDAHRNYNKPLRRIPMDVSDTKLVSCLYHVCSSAI